MSGERLQSVTNIFTRRKLPNSYPRGVITPHTSDKWRMTPAVIHLLGTLTDTDKALLQKTVIQKRDLTHPVPWYPSGRGGGAIVLGTPRQPRIIFTENFFLREIYGRKARHYGNRLDVWLDMLSHEIGHVKQLKRKGNPVTYVFAFGWQYLKTMSHDKAPLEKEAEKGRQAYRRFVAYLRNHSLMKEYYSLLRSDTPEEEKIKQLNEWLEGFRKK